MWQISHTPANGASLGSFFLVKNWLFHYIVPTSLLKTNGTDSFELKRGNWPSKQQPVCTTWPFLKETNLNFSKFNLNLIIFFWLKIGQRTSWPLIFLSSFLFRLSTKSVDFLSNLVMAQHKTEEKLHHKVL